MFCCCIGVLVSQNYVWILMMIYSASSFMTIITMSFYSHRKFPIPRQTLLLRVNLLGSRKQSSVVPEAVKHPNLIRSSRNLKCSAPHVGGHLFKGNLSHGLQLSFSLQLHEREIQYVFQKSQSLDRWMPQKSPFKMLSSHIETDTSLSELQTETIKGCVDKIHILYVATSNWSAM